MTYLVVKCNIPPQSLDARRGLCSQVVYEHLLNIYLNKHMFNKGIITSIDSFDILSNKIVTETGNVDVVVRIKAAVINPNIGQILKVKITQIYSEAIIAQVEPDLKFILIAENLCPFVWNGCAFVYGGDSLFIGADITIEILMQRFKAGKFSFSGRLVFNEDYRV